MSWYHPTTLLDKVFEGGVILKGIDGALEFLGGLLLFFVTPQQLHSFITFITRRELLEDPHDKVANFLLQATSHISAGGRTFVIMYLWLHAIVKLVAVFGLLKNKQWAYPFSFITLGLLMLYQLYTIAFIKASLGMVLLTVFDAVVLGLIWREYRKIRSDRLRVAKQAAGH